MHRLLLVAVLLGFVAPVVAQPATVDGELALGLLGLDDADDLHVGAMDDDLRPFLPPGAVVVGSLDRTRDLDGWGEHTTALARLDADPDTAAAAYADRTFPGRSLGGEWGHQPRGGFASTQGPTRAFQYYPETRDGTVVAVSFAPRPWGGSYVRVLRRGLHRQERLPSDPVPERSPTFDALETSLPLLTAPENTYLARTGSGGSNDDYTSEAYLAGGIIGLPVEDVATHFGAQLAAAGWEPGGSAATADLATSAWTRTWEGKPLAAMFYAVRGDDRIDLVVHVIGPKD